ncbi:hypothetical protein ES703_88049 [subsurface metagenome]
MIEYNVKIKNNKINDKIQLNSPSMSEIANLTFVLQKRIADLIKLDAKTKLTLAYLTDDEGKFKEDKK